MTINTLRLTCVSVTYNQLYDYIANTWHIFFALESNISIPI
ncbi:4543_t:CDS:2 [Dentiscutata heterogama]|uniref:4543_t:CDS:1 n=1 Tax=Dentiscutata heterogama TaxID=1316150 RepID=A0ACA9KEH9_9GLOM|nr:4543_t:CDS:2 [Dentiscutata heterogama]